MDITRSFQKVICSKFFNATGLDKLHAQSRLSALGHAKHLRPFVKKKKSLD